MRTLSGCTAWAVCGMLGLALGCGGCAEPGPQGTSAPSVGAGSQQGSGMGGGTEVPAPAASEGQTETPESSATEPTPAETAPTTEESRPAEAKEGETTGAQPE